jgi:ketosteroid isomerase-like protein
MWDYAKAWEYAKDWALIAPGFTPLVALIAVLVAWRQLVLNRANQRETTAKATFREYLRLAVRYAELYRGEYKDLKDDKREQFEWLAGFFLWSAEELLEFKAKEDVWTKNLLMIARYHRDYLRSPTFMDHEFGTYSEKTQALIKQAISEPGGINVKREVENDLSAYAESFNRQDAAGIAALYATGGIHINPAGPRTDIEQFYQGVFKAGFDQQEVSVDDAWPLGAGTALAIGQYRISGKDPNGTPLQRGGYWTATYVREGGKWKIRMQAAIPK